VKGNFGSIFMKLWASRWFHVAWFIVVNIL